MFYEEPLELQRGDGVWLFDSHDDRYLDLYNNVPCVGHGNPRVAAAIAEQAATLNVHSRYLHRNVIDYVERLVDLHHDGLESAVMACSGTEATEVAIMMARAATGHHGVICTNATYHGNLSTTASLRGLPVGTDRGGVRAIASPDSYRPIVADVSESELCEHYLDQLKQTIEGLQHDGHGVAALIVCSILANEGLPNVPDGWFSAAADIVRDAGGLVIADEVQAGFARSGHWWGYEANGFVPDIATLGKPMGNGLPVSAVLSSHELVSGFRKQHQYFNTFAASPLQAAAGNAVIDEITDRGLVAQVGEVGEALRAALSKMQVNCAAMGEVRGVGMFTGIDWVLPGTTTPDVEGAAWMVEAFKRRKMLLSRAGQFRNVLKVRPPLIFDHSHLALFLEAFDETVAEYMASGPGADGNR
jgi:4-aminobutyrate aminotransferase-like enzyme